MRLIDVKIKKIHNMEKFSKQTVKINASAETVFDYYVKRPNKFPSSKLLETKFFRSFRILSTGSFQYFIQFLKSSSKEREEWGKDIPFEPSF